VLLQASLAASQEALAAERSALAASQATLEAVRRDMLAAEAAAEEVTERLNSDIAKLEVPCTPSNMHGFPILRRTST